MFDLKRPCTNCPFRKGQRPLYRLSETRLRPIFSAPAFQCHKTISFDEEEQVDGDWDDTWRPVSDDERAQQCAGLMAVLHRERRLNTIMQVAHRLGRLDLDALDPNGEACGSFDEVVREHRGGR